MFFCVCFFTLVSTWCVVIPMYVLFASLEQVNLYSTLDNKAKGVVHLRGKYEAVFDGSKIYVNIDIKFEFNQVC